MEHASLLGHAMTETSTIQLCSMHNIPRAHLNFVQMYIIVVWKYANAQQSMVLEVIDCTNGSGQETEL